MPRSPQEISLATRVASAHDLAHALRILRTANAEETLGRPVAELCLAPSVGRAAMRFIDELPASVPRSSLATLFNDPLTLRGFQNLARLDQRAVLVALGHFVARERGLPGPNVAVIGGGAASVPPRRVQPERSAGFVEDTSEPPAHTGRAAPSANLADPIAAGLDAAISAHRLHEWASEMGVDGIVGARLEAAAGDESWRLRELGYYVKRISSLLENNFGALPQSIRGWSMTARPQVREFVIDSAHRVAAVLAKREVTADAPPARSDEGWQPMLDGVRALRRDLLEEIGAWPLIAPAPKEVRVRLDPPSLLFTVLPWRGVWEAATVELRFDPGPALVASCSCGKIPGAGCAHRLVAIDLIALGLTQPEVAASYAPLVASVVRPAWERWLLRADMLLADDSSKKESRLAWWFRHELTVWRLDPLIQTKNARGEWTRGRVASSDRLGADEDSLSLLNEDEAAIAALAHRQSAGLHHSQVDEPFLAGLEALAGHPRIFVGLDKIPGSVKRDELRLRIDRGEHGFSVFVELGGRKLSVHEPGILRGVEMRRVAAVDPSSQVITVARIEAKARRLLRFAVESPGELPEDAAPAIVARLPLFERALAVQLPDTLRGDEVPIDERPLLRLELAPGPRVLVELRVRPLAEGVAQLPGEGTDELYGLREGARVYVVRRRESELQGARRLASLLALEAAREDAPWSYQLDSPDDVYALVDAIAALAEGAAQVEWARGDKVAPARFIEASRLRIQVRDQRDWFGVEGSIEIEGARVPLGQLLAAVRDRRRYLTLPDGAGAARIADDLRERLSRMADLVHSGRGGLQVSIPSVGALAELVDDEESLRAPRRFLELVRRVRAAEHERPEVPLTLRATLRDYQVEGFRFLARLASWGVGGCLADDMGLGKTVQALALLLHRASLGPALVVAPTSVCWGWVEQAERFAPDLRMSLYADTGRAATLASAGPGDVIVVSYGLLVRDAESFHKTRFATVVLDEAQAFKNEGTHRARAVRGLQSDFRVALTGTPIENRLGELWSLFAAVAPGLLGSAEEFRARFVGPIERDRDPERRASLARLIRPFVLRRLKSEVARELPARTEIREDVLLSPAERALYEEVRLATVAALQGGLEDLPPEQRRFQVLAAITRLRQLACHPALLDPGWKAGSSKLTRLVELVEELRGEGHRALVFSQFTRHLELVRGALERVGVSYQYLDGATPAGQRRQRVDAFQSGEGDVFLISLKAGGFGLNLTAADYVIHLDPWWNPAVEDQASDRAHRIGQTRPVTVCRLVSRGTIEEQILALHADKRDLVSSVLDGTGGAGAVSTDDLLSLLHEGTAHAAARESSDAELSVAVASEAPLAVVEPAVLAPAIRITASAPITPRADVSMPSPVDKPLAAASASVVKSGLPVAAKRSSRRAEDQAEVEGVRTHAGDRDEDVGDGDWSARLLAEFGAHLEGEVRRGVIGRPETVNAYRKTAQRLMAYAEARGERIDSAEDARRLGARYVEELRSGALQAPQSDATWIPTVTARIARMLEQSR